MKVNGKHNAPATLSLEKKTPSTHCIGSWVGVSVCLLWRKKSLAHSGNRSWFLGLAVHNLVTVSPKLPWRGKDTSSNLPLSRYILKDWGVVFMHACISDLRQINYEGVNAQDSSVEGVCDDDNTTFIPI